MTTNFYFIRHGFSCANLKKHKGKLFDQKVFKDPHLTNWGIIASVLAGLEIKQKLSGIHFNRYMCSPLLRTWETGSCMLSSSQVKEIWVGPYLREFLPSIISSFIVTQNDNPDSFNENKIKYKYFLEYIVSLVNKWKELNKTKYKSSITRIEKQLLDTKNIKICFHKKRYSSKYTSKGDISKFIEWYLKKFNPKPNHNVAVVCHGTLIKDYVKKFNKSIYEELKQYENNNFVIRVRIKNKEIQSIDVVYKGFRIPDSIELKDVRSKCSMCNTIISFKDKECKGEQELKDKDIHNKIIDRHFKI